MAKKGYGHGGIREGQGRKYKWGVPTKTLRVPVTMTQEDLDALIKLWLKNRGVT